MKYRPNFIERYVPYDEKSHNWPQILTIFIVALGGFSSSALYTWTSPSIPILISNISHIETVTIEAASYLTVISPISAAIASPLVALALDLIGRKKTVLFIAVPHITACLLVIFAKNIYVLYASRFVAGLGDAVLFCGIPTYIGEIAVPSVRGSWGNLVAIGIYFGQFTMNVVGSYYDIITTASILIWVPIIMACFTMILPESPYYLLMKGREDEARNVLRKFRWRADVEHELSSLSQDVQRQISESGTFKDLITIATNRKALLISIAIRGCQQLSGLPAFAVYTQYMFNEAGGNLSASTSAIIYTGVLFCMTSGYAFVVERFGRRPLMIFSSFGCAIVLLTEATYFLVDQKFGVDVSGVRWIPLAGMICYIVVCSSGLGIIPTLMLGELFSTSVKGKALCVLNICFSIYILSVSKLFQVLTTNFGMYVPFFLFSGCCFVGTVFSYFCIPETKGKTLEEIQEIFRGGKKNDKDIQLS